MMELILNKKLAADYTSFSQQARVLTEDWVSHSTFCPNCGKSKIIQYENNRPVADFYCKNCREQYELKSKHESIGAKIVDGAYETMLARLRSVDNPNFFLLQYDFSHWKVKNFFVIPKHFFIPEIIERRKPLAETARRAGWIGCNILLNKIPESGKIFFVNNGQVKPKEHVLSEWKKTLFLREEREISVRGWLLDVMRCIEKLKRKEFVLEDVYAFEKSLIEFHPENRHIKDKIRQQLQVLRDKGYLEFSGRGYYRLR